MIDVVMLRRFSKNMRETADAIDSICDFIEKNPFPQPAQPQYLESEELFRRSLGFRARKACSRVGVFNFLELSKKTEGEMLCIKNCGVTSVNQMKEKLEEVGLSFAPER